MSSRDPRAVAGSVPQVLLGLSILVWGLLGVASFTFGSIAPDEVGVLVNNLWGTQETLERPGTYLYNALTSDMILLDKSEQTIVFTNETARGDHSGKDGILVKTRDGSDVDVDVTVNYAIIPAMAQEIIALSGPSDHWGSTFTGRRWEGYKSHWIRDYVRTICRYKLGELTTEEMYDAGKRTEKAQAARAELNELLNSRGLRISSVQIQAFNFYEAYQQKIRDKKLADQEVEEEKSKRNAAMQEQETRKVETEKGREVRIAEIKGELAQHLVNAQAEAHKKRFAADSEYEKSVRQAEAIRSAARLRAEAIRSVRMAEAKGIEALQQAFASPEGAKNLVMMEYAKRLKDVRFSGAPVRLQPELERFQHYQGASTVPGRASEGGR